MLAIDIERAELITLVLPALGLVIAVNLIERQDDVTDLEFLGRVLFSSFQDISVQVLAPCRLHFQAACRHWHVALQMVDTAYAVFHPCSVTRMPAAEQEMHPVRAFLDRQDRVADRDPIVISFAGCTDEIRPAIIDQRAETLRCTFQPAGVERVFVHLLDAGLDREPVALTQQSGNGVAQRGPSLDWERFHQVCREIRAQREGRGIVRPQRVEMLADFLPKLIPLALFGEKPVANGNQLLCTSVHQAISLPSRAVNWCRT